LDGARGRPARETADSNATRSAGTPTDRVAAKRDAYLPLSLSFVAVPLFDMLSDGVADVVPDDGGEVLGDMLEPLDGGVLDVDEELDVSVDGLVDGDVVEGLIVLLVVGDVGVELVDGVVEGVVVVDDVPLVSR